MSFVSSLLTTIVKTRGKMSLKSKAVKPLEDTKVDFIDSAVGECFTVGFGKSILLPDDIETKKYYIAGYGENNPARGVIDPQYAHAVYIDDNSSRGGVLLISLDVVGLLNKDVNIIREKLKGFCEKTGCRKIDVMSTHNHAGIDTMGIWGKLPFTGKDPKFMEILFEGVKKAAFEAYESRKEGNLYLGTIEVPDMQEDIRTPIVYSKTLTRFRFKPFGEGNEIWLLNFASHSESLQGCNHLVSADFPCYLREKIKKTVGADTLYTVGAIGGMISMDIPDEDILRKEFRLIESTRDIGYKLADYAISIDNEVKLEPQINFATKEFYADVENPVLTIACDIGIMTAEKFATKNAPLYWTLKSEITYYEIGDKKILLLPCEIFPELVFGGALSAEESGTGKGPEVNPELLCDITGDRDILVFGLANDELGYVLPPNDFVLNEKSPYVDNGRDKHNRRHYEETNSVGPKTAEVIAQVVKDILNDINK
ncbi:MAG: hypothetical protein E7530_06980 [Ruminococcaceae bacterium]|nr:hypothetical protein [Oscillospiraceae bacterium]